MSSAVAAPGLAPGVNLDALAGAVRERMPSVIAAVLVGSAVAGRGGCVSDLDITALAIDVPAGTDRSLEFMLGEWPVHIVAYEPMHFRAVAARPDTLLLFVREIRKLFAGVVLFDTGEWMQRTIAYLHAIRMPLPLLRPLRDVVAAATIDQTTSRTAAYNAVENLTFAWMHLDLNYTYTKAKWILMDASTLPARHLMPLLHCLSDEMLARGEVAALVNQAAALTAPAGGGAHFFLSNRKDAATLVRGERLREAVWPLRMAAYMLAESLAAGYRGIASITEVWPEIVARDGDAASFIGRALLLDEPLPAALVSLWGAAREEFLGAWKRCEENTGVSCDASI